MGGAWVPLHHEDILELLFDESHSGVLWDENLGISGESLGRTFIRIWGYFVGFLFFTWDENLNIIILT